MARTLSDVEVIYRVKVRGNWGTSLYGPYDQASTAKALATAKSGEVEYAVTEWKALDE